VIPLSPALLLPTTRSLKYCELGVVVPIPTLPAAKSIVNTSVAELFFIAKNPVLPAFLLPMCGS